MSDELYISAEQWQPQEITDIEWTVRVEADDIATLKEEARRRGANAILGLEVSGRGDTLRLTGMAASVTFDGDDRAPDSIVPIEGVRCWIVNGAGDLEALHVNVSWEGAEQQASCANGATHDAPSESCNCGLHAVTATDHGNVALYGQLRYGVAECPRDAAVAIGLVTGSGKVIEHEAGFRAEKMQIRKLWLLERRGRDLSGLAEQLSRKYGIEVVISSTAEAAKAAGLNFHVEWSKRIDKLLEQRRLTWPAAAGMLAPFLVAAWPTLFLYLDRPTIGYFICSLAMLFALGCVVVAVASLKGLNERVAARLILLICAPSLAFAIAIFVFGSFIAKTTRDNPQLVRSAGVIYYIAGSVRVEQWDTFTNTFPLTPKEWQRCRTMNPSSCTTIAHPTLIEDGTVIRARSVGSRYLRVIGEDSNGGHGTPTAIIRA